MKSQITIIFIALICCNVTLGQHINQQALNALLKKAEETHSDAVIIYHNNKLLTEQYFGTGKPETKIETMSCTKSIVGLVVACMLSDGLIDSLDIPVCKYYPEWKQGQKQYITIRHILNMTTGIQNYPNAGTEVYPSPDFVQLALAAELSEKPGEVFSYNNKSSNLMAGIIEKITHKRMDIYVGERLFKPLGIEDFTWTLDSAGNPHTMAGCQIKPKDFVKIGLLLLNNGEYKGIQIIAEEYIAEVMKPCEQYKGYGLLWWIDYEQTISTVDDEIINGMLQAGVSEEFLDKMQQLKGRYNSNNEFFNKVENIFGKNPWNYIRENLPPNIKMRKKEFKGKTIYRADGYLGNFIIVDPKSKIVAIRMISHESHEKDNDGFMNFESMVINLTK